MYLVIYFLLPKLWNFFLISVSVSSIATSKILKIFKISLHNSHIVILTITRIQDYSLKISTLCMSDNLVNW